jgi:hypothetical protein
MCKPSNDFSYDSENLFLDRVVPEEEGESEGEDDVQADDALDYGVPESTHRFLDVIFNTENTEVDDRNIPDEDMGELIRVYEAIINYQEQLVYDLDMARIQELHDLKSRVKMSDFQVGEVIPVPELAKDYNDLKQKCQEATQYLQSVYNCSARLAKLIEMKKKKVERRLQREELVNTYEAFVKDLDLVRSQVHTELKRVKEAGKIPDEDVRELTNILDSRCLFRFEKLQRLREDSLEPFMDAQFDLVKSVESYIYDVKHIVRALYFLRTQKAQELQEAKEGDEIHEDEIEALGSDVLELDLMYRFKCQKLHVYIHQMLPEAKKRVQELEKRKEAAATANIQKA